MGRVVKLAAVRKSELIDCAEALFLAKGYEATTVADIIERAGVSKGGFYHHFQSKEELLDAMIERTTAAIITNGRDVLDDPTLDALTKINRFLARTQQWKIDALPELRGIYAAIFEPANEPLYRRIAMAAVAALNPVLTAVVEQGMREGLFDVPDAEIVAELLLHISTARYAILVEAIAQTRRGELQEATECVATRIRREEALIDRVLGLPTGSIRLMDLARLAPMIDAMR